MSVMEKTDTDHGGRWTLCCKTRSLKYLQLVCKACRFATAAVWIALMIPMHVEHFVSSNSPFAQNDSTAM